MLNSPRVLDRSPGRFSTTVILFVGALGIFFLPYYFPPRVPLAFTPAYRVGFDNGVAVLAVLGVIGAFCVRNLFWRRRGGRADPRGLLCQGGGETARFRSECPGLSIFSRLPSWS